MRIPAILVLALSPLLIGASQAQQAPPGMAMGKIARRIVKDSSPDGK